MSVKIAIDAGHGLYTAGKRCLKSIDPNETREWTLNSRIATQVCAHLKRCGGETLRLDDTTGETDVALSTRTKNANAWDADWCVSIHHNAGINGGSGGGAVVFVYSGTHSSKSDDLQKAVYDGLIGETGKFGNRSQPLASKNLHMVRETNMPAVLIEVGFMDSTVDTPMILTDDFAAKAARGIAKGICATAGLTWTEETTAAATTNASAAAETASTTAALTVDGEIGTKTVTRLQQVLGTTEDGVISGQPAGGKQYWPAITESACAWSGGKSQVVKALQALVGATVDGKLGQATATATQEYLIDAGYSCGSAGADGCFGTNSAKALQRWLNAQ